MKILILYSGGLDSKIMELYAKINHPNDEIKKVWFDIGQEYSEKEMKCLDSDVDIRKIDYLKDFKCVGKEGNPCGNIMIPGRNAVLALLGASIYLPDEIWLGALCGETHKEATDKNYEFLEKFNTFVNYVLSPYTKKEIKLRFPLADAGFGKLDSVKWALENGYSDSLSIERIDVDGNYEPNNCTWITMKKQANNKRNTIRISFEGEEKTLCDLSRESNIKRETILKRYSKGYNGKDLIFDRIINNTSGIIGVSYSNSQNNWRAYINKDGKRVELGRRKDKEKAIRLRLKAELELYGENSPQFELFDKYGIRKE